QPEWGTQPSNHYLPRRKTRMHIHEDELVRADNPLREELELPFDQGETLDDVAW
ncbi:MAG: ferredoxin, partial [Candidatus Sedimenticola endophacoides]